MPYQRPGPVYNPMAYDPPFTPRYSVPESFRRALSYEGQQHWFMELYQELYGKAMSLEACIVADAETPSGQSPYDGLIGNDYEFKVTWPDGVEPYDLIDEGDVVALRFNDPAHGRTCVAVGYLREACRCVAPERWVVKTMFVIHDLTANLDELTARVTALESQVADHETRIKALEVKAGDHETRIKELETKVADHETRITKVEGDVTNLKNAVSNLPTQADLTEIKTRLTTVENNMNQLNKNIQQVNTRVGYNRKTLEEILAKINGGGTINSTGNITWGDTVGKIPTGNMNVYGGDANYIRTRTGTVSSGSDNDVRVV